MKVFEFIAYGFIFFANAFAGTANLLDNNPYCATFNYAVALWCIGVFAKK
jgi:hypothetical protein